MIRKLIAAVCTVCIGFSSLAFVPEIGFSANAAVEALWPVDSYYSEITTYFDPNRNNGNLYSGHNAIDIAADYGANIYAPVSGTCVVAEYMGDYGNLIVLWHDDLGVYTFYAHCDSFSTYEGKYVSAGDVIGHVGSTGNSDGNHLHFGVCDNLIGGYPDILYHDPLTYFEYGGKISVELPKNECNCSEDNAGRYTTKDVNDYLNIRSGHGTEFGIVGQINKGSEFTVTKADKSWAHVEYNGISGYCSTAYIKRVEKTESYMSVEGERVPDSEIAYGKPYSIGGVISSSLPIKRVFGGIYAADGATPVYVCDEAPDNLTYDLYTKFDNELLFNKLDIGDYVYKIEAQDENGNSFELINKNFSVISTIYSTGDLNGDGEITIADGVLLERYILGMGTLTSEQLKYADLTGDSSVDVYDMVLFKKYISGELI